MKRAPISLSQVEDVFGYRGVDDSPSGCLTTLGYHCALKQYHWVSEEPSASTVQYLQAWRTYVSNIQNIVNAKNPAQAKSTQRLLGLSIPKSSSHSSNGFHIPSSSALYISSRKGRMRVADSPRHENIVTTDDVNRLIKQGLTERLKTRLIQLHSALFDPTCPANQGVIDQIAGIPDLASLCSRLSGLSFDPEESLRAARAKRWSRRAQSYSEFRDPWLHTSS